MNDASPVTLGPMYVAKETATYADPKSLALAQEEIDCAGSCSSAAWLTGIEQHESEANKTVCLP